MSTKSHEAFDTIHTTRLGDLLWQKIAEEHPELSRPLQELRDLCPTSKTLASYESGANIAYNWLCQTRTTEFVIQPIEENSLLMHQSARKQLFADILSTHPDPEVINYKIHTMIDDKDTGLSSQLREYITTHSKNFADKECEQCFLLGALDVVALAERPKDSSILETFDRTLR